jgi:hypothetical protein
VGRRLRDRLTAGDGQGIGNNVLTLTTRNRATNAVLTTAGWEKVAAVAPCHAQAVRDLVVDALSPSQLRQFGIAAAKITRRVEERAPTT